MNEEDNIVLIFKEIDKRLKMKYYYSILYIDDGSTDNTLNIIKQLSQDNDNIQFISLSRNFGHQAALRAGYDYAEGDAIICLDADLQHPLDLLQEMIVMWLSGYDVVYTKRKDTTSTFFKRFTSSFFYKIYNSISTEKLESGTADFRLLDSKVVKIFRTLNESDLFIRGIIGWMGFKQYQISYYVDKRLYGKTKYSLKKMISFSLQGIMSFGISPLRLSSLLGIFLSLLSMLYALYAIYIHFYTQQTIAGWTSLIVCFLFVSGLQFIIIGVMGEYVGKIFLEVKKRPNYLISEHNVIK